jgi:hypothetical protein
MIYHLRTDDNLGDFDAITDFIGSRDADMGAHVGAAAQFILRLWRGTRSGDVRAGKATGMLLRKLIRYRGADWPIWLGRLIALMGGNSDIVDYMLVWLVGHFLPLEPVNAAYQESIIAPASRTMAPGKRQKSRR